MGVLKICTEMWKGQYGQNRLKFKIERGVKQGDPILPNLFNCLLEYIFWKLGWEDRGIKINRKWLSNLHFADDVTLHFPKMPMTFKRWQMNSMRPAKKQIYI